MKRFPKRTLVRISVLGAVVVIALAVAGSAFAWHVDNAVPSAVCIPSTGTYAISVSVTPDAQYPNPQVTNISPTSVPGTTTGPVKVTATVVWSNSSNTQQLTLYTAPLAGNCTMPAPPMQPNCPAGTIKDVSSTPTLLVCIKTNTVTVPGPTTTVTIFGTPPPCAAGVQTASGPGWNQCTVTNTVPGPTVTKIVYKKSPPKIIRRTVTKYKVVNHYIPVPKGCHYVPAKTGKGKVVCTQTALTP